MTIEQLAAEAFALSNEDRALLADRIVESLHGADISPIDELWADEARRRLEEIRSGAVRTVSGEEALARVRRALGQ